MFGNRSEFEQCHDRAPFEDKCCCDFVYSTDDFFKSVPIGLISGVCHGIGLIMIWQYKKLGHHNEEQANPNLPWWKRRWNTVKNKFWSILEKNGMIVGFLLAFALPKPFELIAGYCIEDRDDRIVKSSNTVFSFISTLVIALWFHPDRINHDPKTKVSLRMTALLCFGGIILTLGHMPYEETFTFKEYFAHITETKVLIYLGVSLLIAIGCWFIIPSEYTSTNTIQNGQERKTNNISQVDEDTEAINHLQAHEIQEVQEQQQSKKTPNSTIFFQSIFLMCANTIIEVSFKSIISFFEYWWEEGVFFLIIALIACFGALLTIAFMYLKVKLHYKDPIYMATMMCDMDVINRVFYVTVVYNKNFSCSSLDRIQFWFGVGATIIGIVSLLSNHGKIINDYVTKK